MKQIHVKDLMVPLKNYATVSENATLSEAVAALKTAQQSFRQSEYKHRAVLICNYRDEVVGKLSQLDVIRGLESKYWEIGAAQNALNRFGYSEEYIKSLLSQHSLWDKPLKDICRKAMGIKVKDIMYTPTAGEYVNEDATLDEAIHQLIMGRHQSLLVLSGKKITGILRLTDVFMEVCNAIESCELPIMG